MGNTIYGPSPTPQTAKVCPKSSECFFKPIVEAASKMPSIPTVEFIVNLAISDNPSFILPCSKLLRAIFTSSILSVKFVTPISIKSGVIFL